MIDLETAVDLARAAYYPDEPLGRGWSCAGRIKLDKSLDDALISGLLPKEPAGSDFGFVATRGSSDGTVVCFRGTNPKLAVEVADDLDFFESGGYEAGFYHVFQCLQASLPQLLGLNITVIGHSLGGSMALIMANHMKADVFTFGCPKTFTTPDAELSSRTTRVENLFDPIPLYPLVGYHPVGAQHLIASSGVNRHDIDNYQKRIHELQGKEDS